MSSELEATRSPLETAETQSQLGFIKMVFEEGLPVRLWGGFADDALISGHVSRPHHDVDLAAMRSDAVLLKQELERMGYVVTEEMFGKGDKPYKLLVKGKDLLADIALFDTDERGNPIIDIFYSKTGRRYKVSFDDDMFKPEERVLEGVVVTTVSPLALIRSKDAYFQAGVAGSRPKDVKGKEVLLKKFFPDHDPSSDHFKLKIEKS